MTRRNLPSVLVVSSVLVACGSTVESTEEETSSGTTTTTVTTSTTATDPLCSETTEFCVVCLDDDGNKACSDIDCEYYAPDDVCYPIA